MTQEKIYLKQKVVCNICGKEFETTVSSIRATTGNYSKTCQKCWDKTCEALEWIK